MTVEQQLLVFQTLLGDAGAVVLVVGMGWVMYRLIRMMEKDLK